MKISPVTPRGLLARACLALTTALVACGDPVVPHTTPAFGTYEAIAVAGAPLPYIGEAVQNGGTACHDDILAASLILRPSGTFSLRLSGRHVCDSGVNLPYGHTSNGQFTTQDGRVDFEVFGRFGSAMIRDDILEFVPAAPGPYRPTTFWLAKRDTLA